MSDGDDIFELSDPVSDREYGAVALVAACALAVVLATALVPAATALGGGDSPAESLIPVPGEGGANGESGSGSGGTGGGSGFGALDAGQQQSVGGPIGSGSSAFRSQDTEVHFRVQSETPSYWRTGSYDTYLGGGWERSGPSDTRAPLVGGEVSYRVTLAQSASVAPTVWQPTGLEDADGVELTEGGVARAVDRLPAGEAYVGRSQKPPRDPSILAASGRDYPEALERRYTSLPSETTAALEPVTANVTAGADSPYETATSIEQWLERSKEYSLNVSRPSGDDVAAEFVREMDAGYCEYFATAMTAMLRAEDIPARYVVGYSTGQQVAENSYRVRAMNAHAWVEAYFAGVGWVRFDPTPGSERLRQERQAFEDSGVQGTYQPSEEGSPGETFDAEPNGTDATPTDEPDATPTDEPAGTATPGATNETEPGQSPDDSEAESGTVGSYAVALNRTAVPGATVEVSVTADGVPVAGAGVRFDGEYVGSTGRDGTVTAEVPYVSNFSISVAGGRPLSGDDDGITTFAGAFDGDEVDGAGVPAAGVDPGPFYGLVAPSLGGQATGSQGDDRENATRSVEVATNATLSVSGDVRTGAEAVVTATVEGVAVPNATLWLDGRRVGQTDTDGRATVSLPDSPGNVTLRVEREPVAGERTLRVPALSVSTRPLLPLPVAGTPLEVTAQVDGDPVPDAAVRVNGDDVGETDVNGSLVTTLPLSSSVEVSVASDGQTARTTVANPLANAAGVGVAAVGLVAVGAVVASRRERALGDLPARLARAVGRGARFAVRLLVGIALAVAGVLGSALDLGGRALGRLRALLTGEQSLETVFEAFRTWLDGRVAALSDVRDAAARSRTATQGGEADGARTTVREAWGRFLDAVSVREPATKTPDQIATHAVGVDDLPFDAVATLRDEFRAVEYGPRSAAEAVPAVERAIRRVETAVKTDTAAGDGQNSSAESRDDSGDSNSSVDDPGGGVGD